MARQEQINRYLWESKQVEYEKVCACAFCKSKNIIKRGVGITEKRGNIQRFSCKDCSKKFSINEGFKQMRFTDQMITMVLDMYYRGMSLRKIKDHLQTYYQYHCSHMTILRWIRKYSKQIGNYVDKLPVNNSNCITFDEIEYKTQKIKSFFIGVMNIDSRYIVSSDYTMDRSLGTFITLLSKAKKNEINQTLNFYTDGLPIYRRALKRVYGYKHHANKFQHRIIRSSDKEFNWKIERFNNTVRERTKIMRQFKALWSAKLIMKGFEIYYNFCRKHTGINAYPYELVTDLKLGKNKWLDLINLSSQS
ncbi:MAG: DDE-type integrase/transposase/recombinase [bacterium]|nr:DDE-type integrase/transposase/recombinase [bacterium]